MSDSNEAESPLSSFPLWAMLLFVAAVAAAAITGLVVRQGVAFQRVQDACTRKLVDDKFVELSSKPIEQWTSTEEVSFVEVERRGMQPMTVAGQYPVNLSDELRHEALLSDATVTVDGVSARRVLVTRGSENARLFLIISRKR